MALARCRWLSSCLLIHNSLARTRARRVGSSHETSLRRPRRHPCRRARRRLWRVRLSDRSRIAGGPGLAAAPVLSVGGAYQITPSLLQNGCGAVEVQPGPATVAHTPGATTLSLTHVGQTYTGTIAAGGAFSTTPRAIALGNGSTDTVTIAGTFATAGFDATVTVDENHAGAAPCAYTVRWAAAKQGAANVIP